MFHALLHYNQENLFLKVEPQTNSKDKPKFLNVNFLDTFCICSRKNGGKGCLCFNTSYITYFRYSLCRKLTKGLALHGFGEIFTHAIWLISPHTPYFCSTILPGFTFLCKTPKRDPIRKTLVIIECLNFE